MKKIGLVLGFILCTVICFGQAVVPRSNSTITVQDSRTWPKLNSLLPRYADTATANLTANIGLDSASAMISLYDNTVWVRTLHPKRWQPFAIGNTTSTNIYNSDGALTGNRVLSGSNTHYLVFDSLSQFGSFSYTDISDYTLIQQDPNSVSIRDIVNGSDNFVEVGTGLIQLSSLNKVSVTSNEFDVAAFTKIRTSDSVGTRFSFNFGSGALAGWGVTLPNTTTAFDANGTTFTATGGMNLNNHIDQGFTVGVPDWTIYKQKVVVGAKNGTSYGFWFRFSPVAGNGQSFLASFLLADTSGYIAFGTNNAAPDASYPNNRPNLTFKWNVGDTLEITVQRQDRNAIMSMKNLTTGLTSKMTYTVAITGTVAMSVGFYGGIWKFLNTYDFRYNEIKVPALIGLGNSLMWGANATTQDSTYFNLIASSIQGGCINMGHPSETSANGVQNVTDIVTYLQANSNTVCLVEYGVNDHNGGTSLSVFGANLRSICTSLLAAGIKVVLVNCVPQSTSIVSYNDTINSVANSFTPHIRVADIYTQLVGSGTTINPIYAYGDGVHINNRGSVVCAGVINRQIQDLVTYGSPLNVSPLPTIANPTFFVGMDQDNNFGRSVFGASNAYIKNSGTPTTANVQTPGDIDISGTIWGGTSLAIGGTGSIQVNPNFSVNILAPGYTAAALFTSQNFTTSATTSTFDGSGGSRVNFTNAPPLNFFAVGANIVHNNGTSTYNTRFSDNGSGMAITNGNYNYLEFWRNNFTTKVAHINRGGGGEFDSTLTMPNVFVVSADSTAYKPAVFDASGNLLKGKWAYAGGGGGSGVTNVATNANTGITGGPITTTGTVAADTTLLSTRAWRQKGLDSLATLISGGGTSWSISGNAGTVAGTNYLGSSDNIAIDFRTNATQAMRLNTAQELMIASTTDQGAYKLQVTGDQIITGSLYVNAASNHVRLRNSGNAAAAEYDISSANIGGSANPDFYISDVAGSLTPFAMIEGTGNIGLYGATGFTSPTSGVQLFTSFAAAYIAKTANYSLTISDYMVDCTSGSFTITLPTAVGITGRQYVIKNSGTATTITIATTSSQTIDGSAPSVLTTAVPLRVMSDGANWKLW